MSCPVDTKFKSVSHYGNPTLLEQLEVNVRHWLDWAFLCIGAWDNVYTTHNNALERLYPVENENRASDDNFYGLRKQWVHEDLTYYSPEIPVESIDTDFVTVEDQGYTLPDSGNVRITSAAGSVITDINQSSGMVIEFGTDLNLADVPDLPATVSFPYSPLTPVIYRDDNSVGTATIDYQNGVVDLGIADASSSQVVTASYSYRLIQTYIVGDQNWAFEIQKHSLDFTDQSIIDQFVEGSYAQEPSQRVQLPAVLIESVADRKSQGFQLGSQALRTRQKIMLTVVASNKYERNTITDILAGQKGKTIKLYDVEKVSRDGKLPLNFDGTKNSSGLDYDDIVANDDYYWSSAYIYDTNVSRVLIDSPEMYMSKVLWEVEVIR